MGARPRILDLYCGEGGAGWGYFLAGCDVFGVDLNDDLSHRLKRPRPRPLKRYPFPSREADALAFLEAGGWRGFDAIHASPPCQKFSSITRINTRLALDELPDLIGPTRDLLAAIGLPFIIENTEHAPLREPVKICGSMFDPPLDVQRHRLFESNWPLAPPAWPCRHKLWTPRFHAADYRGRRSGRLMKVVPVYGGTRFAGDNDLRRRAMEIDWMTSHGLKEAIPPRYTEFIGRQLLAHLCGGELAA